MGRRPRLAIVALLVSMACASCGRGRVPASPSTSSPTSSAPVFSGVLECPGGTRPGGATWDYGANAKGTIEDPVGWVHDNATGLDPHLVLSFLKNAGDLDNIVVATRQDGVVLAWVRFGLDDTGKYSPQTAEACNESGIQDFNLKA